MRGRINTHRGPNVKETALTIITTQSEVKKNRYWIFTPHILILCPLEATNI